MVSAVDKALTEASKLQKKGEVEAAKNIFVEILKRYPSNKRLLTAYKNLEKKTLKNLEELSSAPVPILNDLVELVSLSKFDEVIEQGKRHLKEYPNDIKIMQLVGSAFTSKGDHANAIGIYELLINVQPNNASTHNLLGFLYKTVGDDDKALRSFEAAFKYNPNHASAYNNAGLMLKSKKQNENAIIYFKKSLKINASDPAVWDNLGVLLAETGELISAEAAFDEAIKLNPKIGLSVFHKALTLHEQGRIAAAQKLFDEAQSLGYEDAQLLVNLSAEKISNENFPAAIELLNRSLKINPNLAEAHFNLGKVFELKKDWQLALESYGKAISLKPNWPEAFNNMGVIFKECLGKPELAIHSFATVAELRPTDTSALKNLANSYVDLNNLPKAIEMLEKVIHLQPDEQRPVAQKMHLQSRICDWSTKNTDVDILGRLTGETDSMNPFSLLSQEDKPERHLERSKNYSKFNHEVPKLPPLLRAKKRPKKLRIGYFSGDFYQHPVSRILVRTLELHDRDRFEVFGYSTSGFTEDHMRRRIINAVDVFKDVRLISDLEAAQLARGDELDIAVDLSGYTRFDRTSIFARRVAPVQINYLGYPGSLGSDFMDYIIGDRFLIPEGAAKYYTESPIYLPDCYQARDDTIKASTSIPSKADLGLPKSDFIFCAINNYYKISPEQFDVWMKILTSVPGSVLWLLGNNNIAQKNLLSEAAKRGVAGSRLIFAKSQQYETYLATLAYADMHLDTFIYNAGATAGDLLSVGVPILTKSGKGYSARMAGSILNSLGLKELITNTVDEYETKAVDLAQSPRKLADIKNALLASLEKSTFTNPKMFTLGLEKGYDLAYHHHLNGERPKVIKVRL
ncbi:tetratricopeptide repeat protein [Rhodobacterales bacterium FZCC0083]|nr:tetratricopeptide repeat protein [Rhodobacterales bacterium FZCC0083]